jgi:hypothetical protein
LGKYLLLLLIYCSVLVIEADFLRWSPSPNSFVIV